jgi:hypothetical protein
MQQIDCVRRWRLAVLAAVGLAACGGSEAESPSDAAPETVSDSSADAPLAEDATEGDSFDGNDGAGSDACDPKSTTPRELVSGESLWIVGTTTDDDVIVQRDPYGLVSRPVIAAPLDCSPPKTILDAGVTAVNIHGSVVFAWEQALFANPPLRVWSRASGAHEISTNSFPESADAFGFSLADATNDGKAIAFMDNVVIHKDDAGASYASGDVAITDADGGHRRVVVPGATGLGYSCFPWIKFVGTRLVVGYCPEASRSDSPATIVSVDPATGSSTTIATGMREPYFMTDASGTVVAMYGLDGAAYFAATAGGTTTKIADGVEQLGIVGDPASGFAWKAPSGAAWMYAPRSTLAPITVFAASPAIRYPRPSPDGTWITFNTAGDVPEDLWLGPATSPGAPKSIVGSATTWPLTFTTDSSYALYLANWDEAHHWGDLTAVARDGTTKLIAARVVGGPLELGAGIDGTKVVFGVDASGGTYSAFDLYLTDVSRADPATLLVRGVDAWWTFDESRTTLIYTTHAPGVDPGLYAVSIP